MAAPGSGPDATTPSRAPTQKTKTLKLGPPSEVHANCLLCNMHFYSLDHQKSPQVGYQAEFSDTQAQRWLDTDMEETRDDLIYIREKLRTHGDLVISRWFKKSKDKRGRLLSEAADWCFGEWPRAASKQLGPDLDPASFQSVIGSMLGSWLPKSYQTYCDFQWAPWIQSTDLAEDRMKLLQLFHVRTSYSRQEWAMFDTGETAAIFDSSPSPSFQVLYNPKGVQMYGEGFGRLVDFNTEMAHSRVILGFPRAVICLCAQRLIAMVLHKVIDAITADASPSGDCKWLALMSGSSRGGSSSHKNAGFMSPSVGLDTALLLQLSRDRLDQVVDEVELMQTDPEYMRDYVLSLKASIYWEEGISPALKWGYVAECISNTWTYSLGIWHVLVRECQALHDICRENYQGVTTIMPGTYLSPEVTTHYHTLVELLRRYLGVQMSSLHSAIQDMSAVKNVHRKVVKNGKLCNIMRVRNAKDPKDQGNRITVALAIFAARTPSKESFHQGRMGIGPFKEELSDSEFDKRVDDQLSDLALLDTLRLSVICSQVVPNSQAPKSDMFSSTSSEAKTGASPAAHVPIVQHSQALGLLLRTLCDHPWPKGRYGPLWLEKTTETRGHLTKFWIALRDHWFAECNKADVVSGFVSMVSPSISICLSPAHLAKVDEERKQCEAEIRRSEDKKALQENKKADAVIVAQSTWGTDSTSEAPLQKKRTKAKLARTLLENKANITAPSLVAEVTAQPEPSPEQPPKQQIAVKQDSLSVFNKMFNPDRGNAAIRWTQLTQALTDAGLVMTHQPSSAYKFSRGKTAVIFDKPHPQPLVSPVFLRHHVGRRLSKWFGWDNETFVLRVKNVEESQAVGGGD